MMSEHPAENRSHISIRERGVLRFFLGAKGDHVVLLFVVLATAGCQDPSGATNGPPVASPSTNDHAEATKPTSRPASDAPATVGNAAEHDAGDKPHIDFVKENGAIFQDWPKPKLAIVLTGDLRGYIEPCGCAGLENQKGGLSRLHSMMVARQKLGWPIVAIDLGGLVRRTGPQASVKYQRIVEALRKIGFGTIGFDAKDLRLPTQDLLATLPQNEASHFVSANVTSIFDEDLDFGAPYRIFRAGGMKVGVTSVLSLERGKKVQNPDFQIVDPAQALPAVLEKLKAEQCDYQILLANTDLEEGKTLARQFEQFDVVVVAGDSDPPPNDALRVEGTTTRLVELGHKGMYAGVLGLFDDPKVRLRYQRVPLDARFEDSKTMVAVMAAYQDQLKGLGLDGLSIHPSVHPSGRTFVGSNKCSECHQDEYDLWKKTPHGHALETLVKLPTPRHHDPECLSCHVTGWEPQEYFPFTSGYRDLKSTPHLRAMGCENCHGPGSQHVAAENGDTDLDDDAIEALRGQMRQTIEEASKNACAKCHDLDNSPDFDFDTYWPKIKH